MRGGKEERVDRLRTERRRAFGIVEDWKLTAFYERKRFGLRRPRRVGGGLWSRGGMNRYVDAAIYSPGKERSNQTGKVCYLSYAVGYNLRSDSNNWPSRQAEGTLYAHKIDGDLRST